MLFTTTALYIATQSIKSIYHLNFNLWPRWYNFCYYFLWYLLSLFYYTWLSSHFVPCFSSVLFFVASLWAYLVCLLGGTRGLNPSFTWHLRPTFKHLLQYSGTYYSGTLLLGSSTFNFLENSLETSILIKTLENEILSTFVVHSLAYEWDA